MHAVVTSAPENQGLRVHPNTEEHNQFMVGEINAFQMEETEYEGTNYDLVWGVMFGYILNVLMILCVKVM